MFLKSLQRELGMTFIYVTHDQEEALTMSDHLAVFNDGRIEQVGAPDRGLRASGDRVRRRLRRHLEHHRAQRPAHLDPTGADRAERRRRAGNGRRRGVRRRVPTDPRRHRRGRPAHGRPPERRLDHRAGYPRPRRLARRGRVRDPTPQHPGGQMTKRMWALLATLAVAAAFPAAGATKQTRRHAQHGRVGGLPPAAVGQAVREAERLHRSTRSTPDYLGRDGDADAVRRRQPVRHGLGVRRRVAAPDLRQGRPAGRSVEDSRLQELQPRRSSRRRTTPSAGSTTASRCSGGRTRCSTTRRR